MLNLINFGGHDEIALGEAVDLVGPEGDFNFAPCQEDIGMMSLLLGKRADPINERKCLLEVGKSEGAAEVVFVSDVPARDFLVKVLQIDAFERGDVAAAGNAGFGGEGHTVPMINLLVMRFQPQQKFLSSFHVRTVCLRR